MDENSQPSSRAADTTKQMAFYGSTHLHVVLRNILGDLGQRYTKHKEKQSYIYIYI